MALAILKWQEADGEVNHFDIDIGNNNRYYRYEVGDKSTRSSNGLKRLSDPTITSSLLGPLPEESLGRKTIEIRNDKFDRTNRYVQLFSFRNAQLDGPALSKIVEVPVASLPRESNSTNAFALELEENMPSSSAEQPPVEVIAFAYKEARPVDTAMSIAMAPSWLSKIGNIAKKATAVVNNPQAQQALKQAGSFLANPQKQQMLMNAGTSLLSGLGQANQQPLNTEAIQQLLNHIIQKSESIEQLVNSLVQSNKMNPGLTQTPFQQMPMQQPMLANAVVQKQNFPAQQVPGRLPNSSAVNSANLANRQMQQARLRQPQLRRSQPAPINRNVRSTLSRARSFSTAASTDHCEQMALPMLAALPSLLGGSGGASGLMGAVGGGSNMAGLMPLLQQVMTPETVQMLMQNLSPAKLLGAITDGITQVAKVRLEDKKQDQGHIQNLIANADDAAMEQWAYGQALVNALAGSPQELNYRRVGRVRLEFTELTPLMLHGRSRVLYHQNHDIAFSLKLETPRPIAKGILQMLVKDPETLEILIEDKYPVENLESGALEVTPKLSREQLEILNPNEDYLVTMVLVWKGGSRRKPGKRRIGTSMTQMITLIRDYCFDRIEGQEETIALSDVDRYRAYWHKVWQGNLSSRRRRLKMDCKYYYSLEPNRTALAKMETLTRIQRVGDTRHEGQLKSGMMLNPERLNELLSQISEHPPLEEEQLSALLNSDNVNLFSSLARTELKFKGRPGNNIALWVYPEFKIQRILLKQASVTNDNGHVTELEEHPVYFPMPAKAHFIGVSDDD